MANAVVIMECKNAVKSIDELTDTLKQQLNFDAELVYETKKAFSEATVVLLSFEKYFLRNGNYASLTVMLTEKDNIQTADIVSSGGGEGLLNFSWGSNDSFAQSAVKILKKHGFSEIK